MPNKSEIGGIFHFPDERKDCTDTERTTVGDNFASVLQSDDVLCLTGRDALGIILDDAAATFAGGRNSQQLVAYVPSYCCEAMLGPIVARGFKLRHYPVTFDPEKGIVSEVDLDTTCDLFLTMSYFGVSDPIIETYLNSFQERGVVTIRDITHSFLTDRFQSNADYVYASLRKWIPIPAGGFARKVRGRMSPRLLPPGDTPRVGLEAMLGKSKYLAAPQNFQMKQDFLELSRRHQEKISNHSASRSLDPGSLTMMRSVDVSAVRHRRVENLRVLQDELGTITRSTIQPQWFGVPDEIPLFLPIFVPAKIRDELVKSLRNVGVFSPVHWPIPPQLSLDDSLREIYNTEVSLVCDQRYGVQDMKRVVDAVRKALS